MIEKPEINDPSSQEFRSGILPSDVRYALQHRGAQLGPNEILDLARNGFENEGLYVLLKVAENDSNLHSSIMKKIVAAASNPLEDERTIRRALRDIIETSVPELPKDSAAVATKLAQYSRQGFDHWKKLYEVKAVESAKRSNPTFIVGNSMFVGLAPFVLQHARAQKPLYALMPSYIADTENRSCGYKIADGSTDPLQKDFERDPESIIIDDVKHTGQSELFIKNFWVSDNTSKPPRFEVLSTSS